MHWIRKSVLWMVLLTFGAPHGFAKQDGKLAVASAPHKGKKGKRKSPTWRVTAHFAGTKLLIDYARPAKRGRKIFGELVPWGQVWRTGANEATTVQFNKPIRFKGKVVPAGTYGLFTIPGKKKWTIILNKNAKQWGAYSYDKGQDLLRFQVDASTGKAAELFTINVKSGKGKQHAIVLKWDTTRVRIPIAF